MENTTKEISRTIAETAKEYTTTRMVTTTMENGLMTEELEEEEFSRMTAQN